MKKSDCNRKKYVDLLKERLAKTHGYWVSKLEIKIDDHTKDWSQLRVSESRSGKDWLFDLINELERAMWVQLPNGPAPLADLASGSKCGSHFGNSSIADADENSDVIWMPYLDLPESKDEVWIDFNCASIVIFDFFSRPHESLQGVPVYVLRYRFEYRS